jgi:hypothetical protein
MCVREGGTEGGREERRRGEVRESFRRHLVKAGQREASPEKRCEKLEFQGCLEMANKEAHANQM